MGEVTVEIADDKVAVITISNPAKLNAWSQAMRVQLREHFEWAVSLPRSECAAIVLTGAGGNFSAGQDLDEAVGWGEDYADTWVGNFRSFYDLPRKSPKPVVAAVEGVCAGSAFQFSLCADFRVSHAEARIGQPEIKSGQASVTGSALLASAVGNVAMRAIVLTARLISGSDAYRLGIVNQLANQADVLGTAKELALEMSDLPHEAYAASKLAICELEDDALDRAFEVAIASHAAVYASGAPREAITKFIGKSTRKTPTVG